MKIRIVETKVYEYEPDLDEPWYTDFDVKDIFQAAQRDKDAVHKYKIIELQDADSDPTKHTIWQVIDDKGEIVQQLD